MGGYLSYYGKTSETSDIILDDQGQLSRKRGADDDDSSENGSNDSTNAALNTPRKKKLKTTSDYIYQVLFVDGENSDVTIRALNKEWKLHKVYIKQCGFFESMFSGRWKETESSVIKLDIPDDNIDAEALSIAFGCLYRDDFTIEPVRVIPVLAAASLLQLDGLMLQCAVIMRETISMKTVCEYYDCSKLYGLSEVEKSCFKWLLNNIMFKQSNSLLKNIGLTLMEDLISSPDLYVMQVEMDVYNLLKRWVFLQVCPSYSSNRKSGITKHADAHFTETTNTEFGVDTVKTYLETTQGRKYQSVFSKLRLEHIIIDLASSNLLVKDKIIPKFWLLPYYERQWFHLINIEQGEDNGPTSETVTDELFLSTSLRCARVLPRDDDYQWRWIGFNYGVDLVIMYSNRMVIFKRNCTNNARLLSTTPNRCIMFRLNISCLNDFGQIAYQKTTGIKSHNFSKDEELIAIHLTQDKRLSFPLRLSLNVLYYTPTSMYPTPNLLNLSHTHHTALPQPQITLSSLPSPHKQSTSRLVDSSDEELSPQREDNSGEPVNDVEEGEFAGLFEPDHITA